MSDSNQIAAMLLATARALGLSAKKCSCDSGQDASWSYDLDEWTYYPCVICDGSGYEFKKVEE